MPRPFIRAVHYFGDQWPVNFWSSFTAANVPADFAQIRADGFNCVVLLLPLRTFLPTTHVLRAHYERRLSFLLLEAERAGLFIILRVGYPFDLAPDNGELVPNLRTELPALLHRSNEVYQLYLDHLSYVRALVGEASALLYVFTSWEDAWAVMGTFPDLGEAMRTTLSVTLGFDRYVRAGNDQGAIVPIPKRTEPLMATYKRFYDDYAYDRFVAPLVTAFPNAAAYEQRADNLAISEAPGRRRWIEFSGYADKPVTGFSYWAPFMGQLNQGESLSANEAFAAFERTEARMRKRMGRSHFVDQFNFVVGTADYIENAARIVPGERAAFLRMALAHMSEHCLGYGLWAYRDYRQSYLINGSFELGTHGWVVEGQARLEGTGPFWMVVNGPCLLQTTFSLSGRRLKGLRGHGPLRLSFELDAPWSKGTQVKVAVSLLGERFDFVPSVGARQQCVEFPIDYASLDASQGRIDIEIDNPGAERVALRGFQFYTYVLSNALYSVDNEPSAEVLEIARFNRGCV